MTEEENFEEYKQMMLKICNDPRKICTWENKKFNLDKYLRKTKTRQHDFLNCNIVEIINTILKLAEDQNVPLKITADFSLTR